MKLRSRKGMTLVELIVAVAFTAVVIGAACSILYYGTQSFRSGTADAFSQQKAALAEGYVQQYAVAATDVSDSADATVSGVTFSISDNTLYVSERTVSGSASSVSEATVDGISKIEFEIENGSLHYTIFAADDSYTLTGGIVLSNSQDVSLSSCTLSQNGAVLFMKTD